MSLKFKLQCASIPVQLESTDGKLENLELREMPASDRDKYLDTIADRVRVDGAGKAVGIRKFDGMQADLLSRCVYYTEGENKDKAVSKATVQGWPSSVVGELFTEAQKINRLNEKEKDDAPKKE